MQHQAQVQSELSSVEHLTDSEDWEDADYSSYNEGRLVIDLSNSIGSTSVDVVNCSDTSAPTPPQPSPRPAASKKAQQYQQSDSVTHSNPPVDVFHRWWLPDRADPPLPRPRPLAPLRPPQPPPQPPPLPQSSSSFNQWWNQTLTFRRWGPPQIVSDRLCACIGCAVSSSHCQAWQPPPPPPLPPPPPPLPQRVQPSAPATQARTQWWPRLPLHMPPPMQKPTMRREQSSHPTSIGCFNCRWCGTEPFRSCRQLALHIQRFHLLAGGVCGLCGSSSVGLGHCRQHAAECLTAAGRSAFLCAACDGRIFASRSALKRHAERNHSGR